jgi:hypothetical protein
MAASRTTSVASERRSISLETPEFGADASALARAWRTTALSTNTSDRRKCD